MAIVKIKPVKAKYSSDSNCTSIDVTTGNDNLNDSCVILWRLLDDVNNAHDSGQISLSGDDYKNWDGNNEFPIQFVCNKLKLEIIA